MDEKLLKELMEDVKASDLDEKSRAVFDIIGIKAMKELAELSLGDPIYFPKIENLTMKARNRRIKREYKEGATISELARKYNLTVQSIWALVKKEPMRGQISLDDFMKSADH